MTSWLSKLEKEKANKDERELQRKEVEAAHQERERLRGEGLMHLYENRYRKEVDAIGQYVGQTVERAKAVGLEADGRGYVHLIHGPREKTALQIASLRGPTWSSKIDVSLEEDGQIKVSYSWHVTGGYAKSKIEMIPLEAVTSSTVENWVKWIVSEKKEDWLSRKWRDFRHG